MNKTKLLELGLSEEQADKVLEGLNGAFVPKGRFNEINEALKAAKAQLAERDQELGTLKEASQKREAEHAQALTGLKKAHAVELSLTNAKAKNHVAAKALLADFLAQAELDDSGQVKGLAEEIERLVKGEDTSFLFEGATTTIPKLKGVKAAERGEAPAANSMTLAQLRKLSPAERYAFSKAHPEEYRALYEGGNK